MVGAAEAAADSRTWRGFENLQNASPLASAMPACLIFLPSKWPSGAKKTPREKAKYAFIKPADESTSSDSR